MTELERVKAETAEVELRGAEAEVPEAQPAASKRLAKLSKSLKLGASALVATGLIGSIGGVAVEHTAFALPAAGCSVARQDSVIAETKSDPRAAEIMSGLEKAPKGSYLAGLPSALPGGQCPGDKVLVYTVLKQMQADKQLPPGFRLPPPPTP